MLRVGFVLYRSIDKEGCFLPTLLGAKVCLKSDLSHSAVSFISGSLMSEIPGNFHLIYLHPVY